jgi:hypothetical protein
MMTMMKMRRTQHPDRNRGGGQGALSRWKEPETKERGRESTVEDCGRNQWGKKIC